MTNHAGGVEGLPQDQVAEFDRQLAEIVKRYPPDRKASAMIPALRLGQGLFGHASAAVQALCADRLGTSPSRAEEVATFYVMLETHSTGKHLVEVCTNVSCCLTGGDRLYAYLKQKLALAVQGHGTTAGTTADGRITLREVECLGACGTAPVMLVDEEMHEQLTVAKVDTILGGLS
jgi:NADH-quinone oxidoreductase subunit E